MIEDEVCNSNYKFLQSISSELNSILYENAYLKAVGELLTSFVNK